MHVSLDAVLVWGPGIRFWEPTHLPAAHCLWRRGCEGCDAATGQGSSSEWRHGRLQSPCLPWLPCGGVLGSAGKCWDWYHWLLCYTPSNPPGNTQPAGDSCLMVASANGHATVVKALLENGASPNIAKVMSGLTMAEPTLTPPPPNTCLFPFPPYSPYSPFSLATPLSSLPSSTLSPPPPSLPPPAPSPLLPHLSPLQHPLHETSMQPCVHPGRHCSTSCCHSPCRAME
jgi:hypothetical protein